MKQKYIYIHEYTFKTFVVKRGTIKLCEILNQTPNKGINGRVACNNFRNIGG